MSVPWVWDGKLSGDAYLERFHADGSPDSSFGNAGQTSIIAPKSHRYDRIGERVIAVGEQGDSDGGILVTRVWL